MSIVITFLRYLGQPLFLIGFSEGALTTATFKAGSPKAAVNARVVEGWTCNAGWSEYAGVRAPESEPVLTLVGEKDPWFQDTWTKGDCGRSISKTNGSISIVYSEPPLKLKHALLEHQEVKDKVISFIQAHMK